MAITCVVVSLPYYSPFHCYSTQGVAGIKFSLQVLGVICQFIAALMLVIKYLRESRIKEAKLEKAKIAILEYEKFERARANPANLKSINTLIEYPNVKLMTENYFSQLTDFDTTERCVVYGAILLFSIGTLFLMFSAG